MLYSGRNTVFFVFLFLGVTLKTNAYSQGVSVNPTGAAAHPSAIMDLGGNQKGFLIPRLTTAERNNISNPARALLIYNLSEARIEVNTGTSEIPVWEAVVTLESASAAASFWKVGGNILPGNVNTLGTLNAKSLGLSTNNQIRIYIDSLNGRVGIQTNQPKASLHIGGSDAIILPSGTTAQRPVVPVDGMIRFNAESGKLEGYANGMWKPLQ